MKALSSSSSHDACCSELSRREFLQKSALLAAGAAVASRVPVPLLGAEPTPKSETLVGTLYKSLSEEQRKSTCFAFDHPLRSKVDNNWQITDKKVSDFFNKDQQEM